MLARDASGVTAAARLEDGIGALAQNSRYSRTLDLGIEPKKPKDAEICNKFRRAEATAYNAKTRPERG